MSHVNLSSFLQLQFNEINIEKIRLGAEEITAVVKQINCIEKIKVNGYEFEGPSFHRLCQEISEIISHTFSKIPALIYYHQIEMKHLSEYHSSLYLIF